MKYKKYIITISFITLFFASNRLAYAGGHSLLDHVKLGIDFGFGFPYEWLLEKASDANLDFP